MSDETPKTVRSSHMSADRTKFSQPVRLVFAAPPGQRIVVPRHVFLAASTKGAGGSRLLGSYDLERRPAAVRNTAYARRFADSLGRFKPETGLQDDGATGERLRREAGAYLERRGRDDFAIPGITFGTRYGGSPVIVADGSTAPPDAANTYVPSASQGGRLTSGSATAARSSTPSASNGRCSGSGATRERGVTHRRHAIPNDRPGAA